MLWRPTITDQHGRRVPVYRPLPGSMCRIPPEEFTEIRASICHQVQRGHSPALVILLMSLFCLLAAVAFGVLPPDAVWALPILFVAIGVWRAIDRRRLPTRNPQLIARALLDRHLCPSCAASLAGVKTNTEGLIICPECRSAWRLERAWVAAPLD